MLYNNVTSFFIRSNGTYFKEIIGAPYFYAQSNYSNIINFYLEDGVSENTAVRINFTARKITSFSTDWFPTIFNQHESREIDGEIVTFALYSFVVPKSVLQITDSKETEDLMVSVEQTYHEFLLGLFKNVETLIYLYPPTEQMSDDLTTAYVIDKQSFYQVEFNDTLGDYIWAKKDDYEVQSFSSVKTYGVGTITVQKGNAPTTRIPIEYSITDLILTQLNNIQQVINGLTIDLNDLYVRTDFTIYPETLTIGDNDIFIVNTPSGIKHIKKYNLGIVGGGSNTAAQDTPPDPNYFKTWIDTNTEELGFDNYDGVYEEGQTLYQKIDPTPEEMPDSDSVYDPFVPLEPIEDTEDVYELEPTGYDSEGNYIG